MRDATDSGAESSTNTNEHASGDEATPDSDDAGDTVFDTVRGGVSRRGVLSGIGAGIGAAGLAGVAPSHAASSTPEDTDTVTIEEQDADAVLSSLYDVIEHIHAGEMLLSVVLPDIAYRRHVFPYYSGGDIASDMDTVVYMMVQAEDTSALTAAIDAVDAESVPVTGAITEDTLPVVEAFGGQARARFAAAEDALDAIVPQSTPLEDAPISRVTDDIDAQARGAPYSTVAAGEYPQYARGLRHVTTAYSAAAHGLETVGELRTGDVGDVYPVSFEEGDDIIEARFETQMRPGRLVELGEPVFDGDAASEVGADAFMSDSPAAETRHEYGYRIRSGVTDALRAFSDVPPAECFFEPPVAQKDLLR